MARELATSGNNLPATVDIMSGLANMQAAALNDGGRGLFMKFVKGDYFYGSDQTDVEEGSHWAVNPSGFVHGYQCWGDGELLGEETAGMGEPPIVKSSLPQLEYEHKDAKDPDIPAIPEGTMVDAKWSPYRGFQLVCTNGEDEGVQCFLSSTSLGMKNGVDKLVGELVAHLKGDPSTPVAIIELKGDSYKHNKYGKTYFPVFKVIEWVDMDATTVPEPEPEEDEPEQSDPEDAIHYAGDDEAEEAEPEVEAESTKPRGRGRPAGSKSKAKAEPEEPTTPQRRTRRRRGEA